MDKPHTPSCPSSSAMPLHCAGHRQQGGEILQQPGASKPARNRRSARHTARATTALFRSPCLVHAGAERVRASTHTESHDACALGPRGTQEEAIRWVQLHFPCSSSTVFLPPAAPPHALPAAMHCTFTILCAGLTRAQKGIRACASAASPPPEHSYCTHLSSQT